MGDFPLWLPPLNRHTDYTIRFTALQKDKPFLEQAPLPSSTTEKTSPGPRFMIRIHATVDFYSESDYRHVTKFKGLNYSTRETFISCRGLMYSSRKKAKRMMKNMLSNFGICFPLYHVLFVQKHYKQRYSNPEGKIWIRAFQNFLRSISVKYMNIKEMIIPLHLRVEKAVTVPDSVHKRWLRWYNYSKQLDPDFKNKYKQAISGPRNYVWELYCDEDMNFEQISTAIFKKVKINTSSKSETEYECSICLEEDFLAGKGYLRSLSCGHIFHQHCIKRWLCVSQVCPLCRATLPLICKNGWELFLI